MAKHLRIATLFALLIAPPLVARGQGPPCLPCAGITVDSPESVTGVLEEVPPLEGEARLYVRWRHDLGSSFDSRVPAAALEELGGTPWIELVFRTPSPILDHGASLEAELAAAAEAVGRATSVDHFQVRWTPLADADSLEEYAFLFKRASVAIAGARPEATVLPQALPADPESLRRFYGEGTAAYLDGIAVRPPDDDGWEPLRAVLQELDPGRPLVLDGVPFPEERPARAPAIAADQASAGASVTLFDRVKPSPATLAPLAVLAREFHGDLAFDPYSTPTGADAWAFVRGEDLGLRVVVAPSAGESVSLLFSDPQLQRPERISPETGDPRALFDLSRSPEGLRVGLDEASRGAVLRLERPTSVEMETVREELLIEGERAMPVEEILRRLQAFEDAQQRRIDHYRAVNDTHLRFGAGGDQTVEATFRGPFFYRPGEGFDWAWEELYLNGIRWRGKRLPEIPLIQPEKAAAMPLEIHFTREYDYTLRGSATVDGREAWVVDFEPRDREVGTSEHLFKGTVWIDREHFGRLRTRALQLGLKGEVISHEETVTFVPVDASGEPAEHSPEAFWLPLHTEGQQLLSVVNNVVVVEREVDLHDLEINGPRFQELREQTLRSEVTMVRDTERGLRYLVHDEDGEGRVVKEGFDRDKTFLLGGVFYDDALDYPLPLAGVNYLSLGFRDSQNQVNFFFAGALLTLDVAQPRLLGSRFDAGFQGFALAVPFTDTVYREGEEIEEEDVDSRVGSFELELGRPLGSFFRLGLQYDATYFRYSDADDTATGFTIPSNHLLSSVELSGRFSRSGYKLSFSGSWNHRSRWDPWGTPAQVAAFDPNTDEFTRWEVRAAKNWYLPRFQILGVELDWVGGDRLDRFSKYQFGFFGSTRVHGYQSNRVRAEEAALAHLSYGFEIGELLRLEGIGDVAWASDEATGLDDEVLAGVGIAGSFLGPRQTLVRLDLGTPVAGPDDGFVAYLVFLKLFR